MWRPLVGLVFVLATSYCALTDRNEFTRDRLEGTGNEPSIAIDKITGGNYPDGAFSIGYGKPTGTAGPGSNTPPKDSHNHPIDHNVPEFNGDNNDLGEGHKPHEHDVADKSSASRLTSWLLALVMPLVSFFQRLF